jgi:hypothetical protein
MDLLNGVSNTGAGIAGDQSFAVKPQPCVQNKVGSIFCFVQFHRIFHQGARLRTQHLSIGDSTHQAQPHQ